MSNANKTFIGLGVLLVFLVGGKVLLSSMGQEDDKALIQKALAESIKASREGRPGGVMDKLSENITFNGQNEGGNQRDIARYIHDSKPEITVDKIEPIVSGEEATIVSPVDITLSLLTVSTTKHLKQVTLVFRKEESRDWLIIPVKRWKLAEVQVPETTVSDLATQ